MSNKLLECDPYLLEHAYYEAIRGFECTACKKTFGTITKKTAKLKKYKCPYCESALESLIMDGIYGIVEYECTTVGQQAERNTKKMGKYLVSELDAKNKKEVDNGMRMYEKPSKELVRKLPKMTTRQKERYIQEGKL